MSEPARNPAARPEAPPPRIPGYRYCKKLGEGGYAVVYLYEDEQLGREVAVKVLHLLDDDARRQFNNEMRFVSGFDNNPHIVPIFNPGRTDDDRPYFIMPFCPKGSLSVKVRGGALPVPEVIDIGLCIGRALDAVHAKHLLHRDVKPSNILIDGDDRPRLSDFGIAGPQRPLTSAERGDLAVSVAWSPPELLDGEYGSVASDLYSLGATLWHLLAGRSPYEIRGGDNTGPALERRIRAGKLPGLDRAGVPAPLEALLRSMLATDPRRRPADARVVLAGLEALAPQAADRMQRQPQLPGILPRFPELDSANESWVEPADESNNQNGEAPGRSPATGNTVLIRRILVPAAVLVVLVGALLGAGALLRHSPAAAAHGSAATPAAGLDGAVPVSQDAGALEDGPPGTPAVTAARVDSSTLQFSWTYADSEASDTFEWRATDGPQSGTAAAPSIDVPDRPGTELCIQVRVVRADGSDASFSWSPAGCGS